MSLFVMRLLVLMGCVLAFGTCMKLPPLPDQFQATVSCNILEKNYTVQVDEIYDFPNNRSYFSQVHKKLGNVWETDVGFASDLILYDSGQRFHVNDSGCFASFLNESTQFVDGESGTKVPNSYEFFYFGGDIEETYVGKTVEDGIPCDHWTSKVGDWNETSVINMTIDYYFSSPEWRFPTANWSQLPVVVYLNGSRQDCNYSSFPPVCNGIVTFNHVYRYSNMRVGPIDNPEKYFTVPSGVTCQGNFSSIPRTANQVCPFGFGSSDPSITMGSPTLPKLPEQFRTTVMANIVNKNYTVQVDEVYDFPNQRSYFRRFHSSDSSMRSGRPNEDVGISTNIIRYDLGERFHVNDTACVGSLLNQTRQGGPGFFGSGTSIPNTFQMFQFAGNLTENFMGTVDMEGIPCNHWQARWGDWNSTSAYNITLDYFFSVPEWKFPTANWTEVPVSVALTGTKRNCTYGRGPPICNGVVPIYHVYRYSNFHVGLEDDDEFWTVPSDLNCTGNFTTVPRAMSTKDNCTTAAENSDNDTWSSIEIGEAAGMVIGSAIGGALLSAAIVIQFARNGRWAPSKSPAYNNEAFNNPNSVDAEESELYEDDNLESETSA